MVADGIPSGTVTFLFTDLVDNTRQWEEDEAAMRAAVAQHDELVTAAVKAHHGHLVKLMGDGAMAVFDRAEDAAAAATALQRTITESPGPVPLVARVGLHTGAATPADGDYHAPAVNRAARVAGAAHGGQVLLSTATASLLSPSMSVDLGEHHLKGLPPMHLHQLLADGLPVSFPPLPTGTRAGAPPRIPTTFVGRAAELDRVTTLLGSHRLVTLTGAGGSGKTRLAIEVLDRHLGRGVFVDLAPAASDVEVVVTVANALGLSGRITDDLAPRVCEYLAAQPILCVLDNCEHVLEVVADLTEEVLQQPGDSHLLLTSREPVGVLGEQVCAVAPLPVDSDAVQLFLDRAREVRPDFELDDTTQEAVGEVCRRLDGLPLAIELAAARTTHLSPTQLLERLDDRFRILTGGRRRVPRHQTLATTLDWSHDLLEPDEQIMLRRLSAFPATFTLDAAESVAGVDGPVDVLGSLVAKSLVQDVPQPDGSLRYRLLETVRIYAGEKAAHAGEAVALHRAHRDLIVEWLEAIPLEQRWFGDRDVLAEERPSVRAALQWSADHGDAVALATLASGVDWSRSSDYHDGVRWCDDALVHRDALPPDLRDRLLVARVTVSQVAAEQGGFQRAREVRDALTTGDQMLLAVTGAWRALQHTLHLTLGPGDEQVAADVRAWMEEAVDVSQGGPTGVRMYCRLLAGYAYLGLGVRESVLDDRCAEHLRAGLAEGAALDGYEGLMGGLEETLAIQAFMRGDAGEALRLATRNAQTPITPMLGHRLRLVEARALAAVGRHEDALGVVRDAWTSMRLADVSGSDEIAALTAGGLAVIAQDWETAARLLHAGSARFNRTPLVAFFYVRDRGLVRDHLRPEERRALREEGIAVGARRALEEFLDG